MTKKDYLLKLLSALSVDIFPAKDDLVYLIQQDKFDDTFLDTLFDMFSSYVKSVNDWVIKQQLEKSIQFIQKLKSIEAEDKIHDQKDIDELDTMLSTM